LCFPTGLFFISIGRLKTWQKICIGIAITCTGLAVLGFWSRAELWHSLYPIAPPMPVVVSETMPEILGRLETILKTNAPQVLESLQPGLSAAAISRLEQQYQVQLPEDIRTIYEWHDGVRQGASNAGYDFIPIHRFVPLEEALEDNAARGKSGGSPWQYLAGQFIIGYQDTWFCLFFDDERNGYWFDPKRKPAEGAVFYNFMEDGSYIFFPSAKNLMAGIAECYEQGIFRVKPGSSPPQLDEDIDRSTKVWEEFGASNQQ
jgi:cell wall assembly regulator SMI1